MITWLKNLKVGDEVYVVPERRSGKPHMARVMKVGRTMLHFNAVEPNGRLGYSFSAYMEQPGLVPQVKTDYGSPSGIYRSVEHYQYRTRISALRFAVRDMIRNEGVREDHITDEQVVAIAKILGVKADEAE